MLPRARILKNTYMCMLLLIPFANKLIFEYLSTKLILSFVPIYVTILVHSFERWNSLDTSGKGSQCVTVIGNGTLNVCKCSFPIFIMITSSRVFFLYEKNFFLNQIEEKMQNLLRYYKEVLQLALAVEKEVYGAMYPFPVKLKVATCHDRGN